MRTNVILTVAFIVLSLIYCTQINSDIQQSQTGDNGNWYWLNGGNYGFANLSDSSQEVNYILRVGYVADSVNNSFGNETNKFELRSMEKEAMLNYSPDSVKYLSNCETCSKQLFGFNNESLLVMTYN